MRYFIISIHLRRHPGDRGYGFREIFFADCLEDACLELLSHKRPASCALILRDANGKRYSVAECRQIVDAAVNQSSESYATWLERFYAEQMELASRRPA